MERFKNFIHFTAEEFAANESFQSYVFRSDSDDISFWENFIRNNPESLPQIEEATRLLSLIQFKAVAIDARAKEIELNRLLASLPDCEKAPARTVSSGDLVSRERHLSTSFLRIAASISILVMLSCLAYFTLDTTMVSYETAYGEHATYVLPDSSVITLNGNSRLRHKNDWTGGTLREVWLDGEAFFDVAHRGTSSDARFIVHVPGMDVEVMGTRFNVFNREDKANVILNSGKVKVRVASASDTSTVVLMPDQALELSRREGKVTRKNVKAETLTAWRNHLLIFENTPLSAIGEMIEQTYGVKVTFHSGVDVTEELAGAVPSENLETLLNVLAKSSNLDITRQPDEIIIRKQERDTHHH